MPRSTSLLLGPDPVTQAIQRNVQEAQDAVDQLLFELFGFSDAIRARKARDHEKQADTYVNAASRRYETSVKSVGAAIGKVFGEVPKGKTATKTLVDLYIEYVEKEMGEKLPAELRPVVEKHVRSTYKLGRAKTLGVERPKFKLRDERAIKWLGNNDSFYVGKLFPKHQPRIVEIIRETMLMKGLDARTAAKELQASLGGLLSTHFSDYENIFRTSSNRIWNWSRIYALQETGVTIYTIVAVMDERTSDICRAMHGREFRVEKAVRRLESIVEQGEHDLDKISPWPTMDGIQKLIAGKDFAEANAALQDEGFDLPPYHGRCRTTYIVSRETIQTQEVTEEPKAGAEVSEKAFLSRMYDAFIAKGWADEAVKKYQKAFKGCPQRMRDAFNSFLHEAPEFEYHRRMTAYGYRPGDKNYFGVIHHTKKSIADPAAARHELAHWLDRRAGVRIGAAEAEYHYSSQGSFARAVLDAEEKMTGLKKEMRQQLDTAAKHFHNLLGLADEDLITEATQLSKMLSSAGLSHESKFVGRYTSEFRLAKGEARAKAREKLCSVITEKRIELEAGGKIKTTLADYPADIAMNDILGAVTSGELGFGHPKAYWRQSFSARTTQVFADCSSMYPNPDQWEQVVQWWPEIAKEYENALDEITRLGM
jgi:SPP1 gp7 family putative phage head morphogenesis protein